MYPSPHLEKRYKIYDQCEYMEVEEGEEIYEEGTVEDYMFIIIKGCVKQYEKKITSYNDKVTVNFVSHYEGSHFGEAQLMGDRT